MDIIKITVGRLPYVHCFAGANSSMKQLPIRGVSLMTPQLSEDELKSVLGKLGVIAALSHAEVHEIYLEIASIYGSWMSEEEAKLVSPVESALRTTGKNLIEASKLLNGRATGSHFAGAPVIHNDPV
jgi:hypothetical protein